MAVTTTAALGLIIRLREMSFAWEHAWTAFGTVLGLLALSVFYRTKRFDLQITKVTLALALQTWAAFAVGGMSLAALGWQMPTVDNVLAAADRALGLDSVAWTAAVAGVPLLAKVCGLVYVISVGAVFGATIILTLLKRTDRVTELSFLFVATIILCAVIGIVFPAYGPFTHLKMNAAIVHALPQGAGTFYMPMMQLYRSGAVRVVDFTRLMGVITFPSFHACMALMVTYAFRGMARYFWPIAAFNLLVGASIVPIGGHYVIDILGGSAVFVAAAIVASVLCYPHAAAAEPLEYAPAIRQPTSRLRWR